MNVSRGPRPAALVVLAIVAGAVAATVLGLLTFGVQATVEPDGVPVAVAVNAGGAAAAQLRAAAEQLASRSGGELSVRQVDPTEARRLLDNKQVYGVLELAPGPAGRGVAATVVVSGAVNPSGTQVAQQALTAAAQGIAAAAAPSGEAAAAPVTVQTVHPASAAGRAAPLAGSALLWIGTLVGSLLMTVLGARSTRSPGAVARVAAALGSALTVTAVVLGLFWLWDDTLPFDDADVIGFMLLVAVAFAAVQGAVLRLVGLPGMAVLASLYLIAPSVAGQVPELLDPVYRTLLWSWTPFRFSTEALRSLLQLDGVAPDVRTAGWVFAVMAVVGLIVLLWPGRRRPGPDAESAAPSKPVPIRSTAA